MPDLPISSDLSKIPPSPIPANLPADQCLALLRAGKAVKFYAAALPPCFRLRIIHGTKLAGMPMSGWTVFASQTSSRDRVVLMGVSEADAMSRAAALNKPSAASGFYSLS